MATSEIRTFESETAAGRGTGVSTQSVQGSRMWGGTAGEWSFHDTPENLRKRIEKLEEEVEYLNNIGIE